MLPGEDDRNMALITLHKNELDAHKELHLPAETD